MALLNCLETVVSKDSVSILRFWTFVCFKRLIYDIKTSSESSFLVFEKVTLLQCSSRLTNCIILALETTFTSNQIPVSYNSLVHKWRSIQTFLLSNVNAFHLILFLLIRIIIVQKCFKLSSLIFLLSWSQDLVGIRYWIFQKTFFINRLLYFLELSYLITHGPNPNFIVYGNFICVTFINITAQFDAYVEYLFKLCFFYRLNLILFVDSTTKTVSHRRS